MLQGLEKRMDEQAMGGLKAALQKWADENGISPKEFSQAAGYSYNHAYQLLRGGQPVTAETLGRVAMFYGSEAVAYIRKVAGLE